VNSLVSYWGNEHDQYGGTFFCCDNDIEVHDAYQFLALEKNQRTKLPYMFFMDCIDAFLSDRLETRKAEMIYKDATTNF
jgi:hypothetical protein